MNSGQPSALADADLEPDPVIEAYKRDVDRTLIREQLKRTVDERVRNMIAALRFAEALKGRSLPLATGSGHRPGYVPE
jgi:hypothetical protein